VESCKKVLKAIYEVESINVKDAWRACNKIREVKVNNKLTKILLSLSSLILRDFFSTFN